jgi:hypothetical protein
MGSCPVIKEVFSNLLRLDRIDISNPTEVLFAFPSAGMGKWAPAVLLSGCHHLAIYHPTLLLNPDRHGPHKHGPDMDEKPQTLCGLVPQA